MTSNSDERYSRQIKLPEIGRKGQSKLKKSKVLVVGLGGLGCPSSQYLASAGIGDILLVDGDKIEFSNMHRQPLFKESDIGKFKAETSANALSKLNSDININFLNEYLSESNAQNLISNVDIVVDGTDNIKTRYIINKFCSSMKKPWVHGSLRRFNGQVAFFHPNSSCYGCLYPNPPSPDSIEDCSLTGVIGAVPGVIGSLEALKTIMFLSGNGPETSQLLFFDGHKGTTKEIIITQDSNCNFCGNSEILSQKKDISLSQHLSPEELNVLLKSSNPPLLIDVREKSERNISKIDADDVHIPMREITNSMDKIPKDGNIVVYCHIGLRSHSASEWLKSQNISSSTLIGGIDSWSLKVDSNVIRY